MYFGALYAKRKSAKNRSSKTWLDGIVMCEPPVTTLYDDAGKVLSKAKAGTCVAGTTMEIGHWEVEVQDAVAEAAFLSGAALAGAAAREPLRPPRPLHPPLRLHPRETVQAHDDDGDGDGTLGGTPRGIPE